MSSINIPRNDDIIDKVKVIWSLLLGDKSFELDDNFFDLGGDSLLLAYLQWHLEKIFSINISIVEFFSNPTIMEMAELVETKLNKK